MKIGMSSASFYPVVDTEDTIELMKETGFNCGEIFLNCPSEYEIDFIKKLNEKKNECEFDIISVHSFSSSFEPYLFDSYKRRVRDMMSQYKAVCRAAAMLGASFYTFHGMRFQGLDTLNMKKVIAVYEELSYIALDNGIKLCQENVSWCLSGNLKFLSMLKEECKSPVYFTVDIKQAYKAGISPLKYINVMGDRLKNLHLNDRDDKHVCLLPGQGNVDFSSIKQGLNAINYSGSGIIEVYRENYSTYEDIFAAKKFAEKFL
jgi:sugar phosphate isomerase/epimerase